MCVSSYIISSNFKKTLMGRTGGAPPLAFAGQVGVAGEGVSAVHQA